MAFVLQAIPSIGQLRRPSLAIVISFVFFQSYALPQGETFPGTLGTAQIPFAYPNYPGFVQQAGFEDTWSADPLLDNMEGVAKIAPEIASIGPTEKSIEADKKEITKTAQKSEGKKEKEWYEKLKIRGYSQFRYNRLAETNADLRNPQGDRSIGEDGSFLIRRARMIFSGDASDLVSYYIQPDFASGATGPNPLHFLQIRDFYADVHLDHSKEHRLRLGQSKVPYGFENLQSSQNRIALDRNDALNSAVVNERDLGVFYYWAPSEIRSRFKSLVDDGLKGSGDYGVIGLGIYNGQTANRPERNDDQHLIGRVTYPFLFANGQIFETGISGYTGIYTIERSAGIGGGDDFLDRRGAVSFVLYPQPYGLQGEWTWGQGPELNAAQTTVVSN